MDRLKSFIYLDEYKMSSLSSQLFEGITEYLVSVSSSKTEKSEQQKGEIGSGRIFADALSKDNSTEEKKVLHDYLYSKFENQLQQSKKVLDIPTDSELDINAEMLNYPFVKITSKAIFNDINSIKSTLENFNTLGEAFAYVTNFEKLKEVDAQLEQAKKSTKDRNKKARLQQEHKSITNIKKLAKETGLHQDEKFLEKLNYLLSYGFEDQFEVQMNGADRIFTANLNRDYLREGESLLKRRYSRITDREFVMFGVIAQANNAMELELEEVKEEASMKQALLNLVEHLTNLENQFTGRLSNEIIIDPIAIYTEL
ncbi:DUF6414 family protein [Oceanospirillum beijerinckii]|uniref:DUF6414 family protein n=1 Tax=Oceanospirillum beijerinckii TaxID=64976 RepID=UPI00041121FD|nr:hypothetical protein [Oceanospirillum beijerinckii]